jgi:hypothetical protein
MEPCNLVYKINLQDYWPAHILKKPNTNLWYIGPSDPQWSKDIRNILFTSVLSRINQVDKINSHDINSFHEKKGFYSTLPPVQKSFEDSYTLVKTEAGFSMKEPSFIECSQFVHTLSKTQMYHYIAEIPTYANFLEEQLGFYEEEVSVERLDFLTYTESKHAITFSDRISFCKDLSRTKTSYWSSSYANVTSDQFNYFCSTTEMDEPVKMPFKVYQNPIPKYRGPDLGIIEPNIEAHLSGEMIFSLPNGLQGYMLDFNEGSRRNSASLQVVVDPFRLSQKTGSPYLMNGTACHACHVFGLNFMQNDMLLYLQNKPPFTEELIATYLTYWGKWDKTSAFINRSIKQFENILKPMMAAMNPTLSPTQIALLYGYEPIHAMVSFAEKKYDYIFDGKVIYRNIMPQDKYSVFPEGERDNLHPNGLSAYGVFHTPILFSK